MQKRLLATIEELLQEERADEVIPPVEVETVLTEEVSSDLAEEIDSQLEEGVPETDSLSPTNEITDLNPVESEKKVLQLPTSKMKRNQLVLQLTSLNWKRY